MDNICSRLKWLNDHQENLTEANTRYTLAKVVTCLHTHTYTQTIHNHLIRNYQAAYKKHKSTLSQELADIEVPPAVMHKTR